MEPDFTGWATKNNIKCSDGRTIMGGAFAHQDRMRVPLVWMHKHDEPDNVLGHAILEHREEGVYTRAFFNDTPRGQHAKMMVQHGDVDALSIYANKLVEQNKNVMHGNIKEVSLVLSGANPEAVIDNVSFKHGYSDSDDEAVIYYEELHLAHGDSDDEDNEEETVDVETLDRQEVLESLNDTQQEVVYDLLEDVVQHSNTVEPSLVQTVFDSMTEEQQAVVHDMLGEALAHAETQGDTVATETNEKTVKDVFDGMTEEQQNVVYFMIGEAAKGGGDAKHDDMGDSDNSDNSAILSHLEGLTEMTRNVFAQNDTADKGPTLAHADRQTILESAKKLGSVKEAFIAHAGTFGIDDIDILFPDARNITGTPEFLSRRMEWVNEVLTKTKHSPIARIKTVHADITADEARARGYVKGNLKKEEVFKLLKRVTEPTTIYKKQKLDRDDIIDITDFDVIAWLKGEMRMMLDEEIARAILVGDGRDVASEDKVNEDKLRPIATDDDMYAHKVTLQPSASVQAKMEQIIRARAAYKGSGSPVMFTTLGFITDMLLDTDKMGRKLYNSLADIAAALQVSKIVDVEVLEQHPNVVGIIVNLADYTVGADKGGNVSMFDDFDIDYNQQKYLIETRLSGALTKAKSAIVILRELGTVVTPASPSFESETNTVVLPGTAGVVYRVDGAPVSGNLVITTTTEVDATPATGYSFPSNTVTSWTFVPTAG